MTLSRALALVLLGGAGAACGSSVSVGGGGGSGATAPQACERFEVVGGPRSYAPIPQHLPMQPGLLPVGDRVALLTREFNPIDQTSGIRLVQVAFEPWGAWPDEPLGPRVELVGSTFGHAVPVTRGPGITLLTHNGIPFAGPPTEHNLFVAEEVPLDVANPPTEPFVVPGLGTRPLFITTASEAGRMAGGTYQVVDDFGAHVVVPGFEPVDHPSGTVLPLGAGLRVGDTFFAALHLGGTHLLVTRYAPGASPEEVLDFEQPGVALSGLHLLPHPKGLWLLLVDEGLQALRLTGAGELAEGPFELGSAAAPWAVGSIDDRLVVVRHEPDPDRARLRIDLGQEGEALIWEGDADDAPAGDDPLAVLASPDGRDFLVAVNASLRSYVLRFSCIEDPG